MERLDIPKRLLPLNVSVGFNVTKFLNEETDEPTRAEVLKVFKLCRELDALRRSKEGMLSADELHKNGTQVQSTLARLNSVLKVFRFIPFLYGGDPYQVFWRGMSAEGTELGTRTIPAANFVKVILDMTEVGTIDRVRQCICGRWFVAQTNKKVVCSDACRFKKFKQGDQEAFNKERAEYMREYRKNAMVAKRSKARGKTK
jgi:hypothetical protein